MNVAVAGVLCNGAVKRIGVYILGELLNSRVAALSIHYFDRVALDSEG